MLGVVGDRCWPGHLGATHARRPPTLKLDKVLIAWPGFVLLAVAPRHCLPRYKVHRSVGSLLGQLLVVLVPALAGHLNDDETIKDNVNLANELAQRVCPTILRCNH